MLAGVKDADGKTYYQQAWHGAMKNQQKEEPQIAQNPRERVSRVIRSHGCSLYIHCIKRHPKSKDGRRLRANDKAQLPRKGKKTQDAADKEKAARFFRSAGVQFSLGKETSCLSMQSIKTEKDFVNGK